MTGLNHTIGGVVFTGFMSSLYNVNIFSSFRLLAVCIFASLLPDIDHTKSLIGKMFLPLSRWLSYRFGHRTITHSILFLCSTTFLVYIFSAIFNLSNYTTVFFFALLSHFILDLITIQGIPLLYPFKKNMAVIPGNVNYRLTTGNIKHEGFMLVFFAVCLVFLQPLFASGFWTSYNRFFQDIQHIHREASKSHDILNIKCKYLKNGSFTYNSGYLIEHTNDKITIFTGKELLFFDKNTKFEQLFFEHTNKKLYSHPVQLKNISIDSLNTVLQNKLVSNFSLNNNSQLQAYIFDEMRLSGNYNLPYAYNLNFYIEDSFLTEKQKIFNAMDELQIKIKAENDKIFTANATYYNNLNIINQLKQDNMNLDDDYQKNENINKIIKLQAENQAYTPPTTHALQLLNQELYRLQASLRNPNAAKNIVNFNVLDIR